MLKNMKSNSWKVSVCPQFCNSENILNPDFLDIRRYWILIDIGFGNFF